MPTSPAQLFATRTPSYVRFVRLVLYPQGIRAWFRGSPLLRSGLRVLDAGCGTGIVTLALRDALLSRGLTPAVLHGFDLTPAMLEAFREDLRARAIGGVEIAEGDVLRPQDLPGSWNDYDLVVSASMLEYLPRERLVAGLSGLRSLLAPGGSFVLLISRRNWLTRLLIGRWWRANLYRAPEIEDALRQAGFATIAFRRFPLRYRHLALWGYVVEASG